MGDVFSFSLNESAILLKPYEVAKSIKAQRIWSLRRRHMAVRDVAVGQDGTVIISTESGSVWTRIRRAKPKVSHGQGEKEYKFARVGSLTRIVAVRANSAGSYAAIRNDVDIKAIEIEGSQLAEELIMSIPLGKVVEEFEDSIIEVSDSEDRDGMEGERRSVDTPWENLFIHMPPPPESCDAALIARDGHRIYFHKAMLVCRCPAFANFLANSKSTAFHVEDADGTMEIHFPDISIVTAAVLAYYFYTNEILPLPSHNDYHEPEQQEMVREFRTLASKFGLDHVLTTSWHIVVTEPTLLRKHLKNLRTSTLASHDAILCLADRKVPCHSFILQARCPFFGAMLDTAGMGGGWVASRRKEAVAEGTVIKIQLQHLSWNVMALVLDHIYTDAGGELFDSVHKETIDEFLEFVIEVMAVSNELLLDRLKDICQSILARFGMSGGFELT
jgi:inhibitor of Bruton tyrosine kinase